MLGRSKALTAFYSGVVTACLLSGCGTTTVQQTVDGLAGSEIPRELQKSTIPVYRVEPPDILLIEAVNNIRPATMPIRAGDEVLVQLANGLPTNVEDDPVLNSFKVVNNIFVVQSTGAVDLGPEYGTVRIDGMSLIEARQAIGTHLRDVVGLRDPQVAVQLPNVNGRQQISGEHLIRPDGTVSMGIYGSVYVAGMTMDEVKVAVENHLSEFVHQPEVNVDVLAYNSKAIYVVTDGGGFGEQLVKIPYTGSDTVMDAIAQISGLSDVSSRRIWVARPAPPSLGVAQTLDVDWRAITQDGIPTTNYQLFPGDRIYIKADPLISLDNAIAKVAAPVSRLSGLILLVQGTVARLEQGLQQGGGGFGGGGGGGFGGF